MARGRRKGKRYMICPICLETSSGAVDWITCTHQHGCHLACLQEWITKSHQPQAECPTCHNTFPPSIQQRVQCATSIPENQTVINDFMQKGYRPCPECGIFIERIEGCRFMTCSMCLNEIAFGGVPSTRRPILPSANVRRGRLQDKRADLTTVCLLLVLFVLLAILAIPVIFPPSLPVDPLPMASEDNVRVLTFDYDLSAYDGGPKPTLWVPSHNILIVNDHQEFHATKLDDCGMRDMRRKHYITNADWIDMPLALVQETEHILQKHDDCQLLCKPVYFWHSPTYRSRPYTTCMSAFSQQQQQWWEHMVGFMDR